MKHIGFKTGFTLLVVGAISGYIQNTYYGYVDDAGIVHDSIFLPLGVLCIILGTVILLASVVRYLCKKYRSENK